MMLGLGTAFAMLGIGVGIVHWAKTLMPDHEDAESRHEVRPEADRQDAEKIIGDVIEETGIKRRPLIRNTVIGAIALAPIPAIFMFRDLDRTGATANQIVDRLRYTMWDKDVKLVRDPSRHPDQGVRRPDRVRVPRDPGGPRRNRAPAEREGEGRRSADAPGPEQDEHPPGREDWHYNGIVAYSKICTHVGCPWRCTSSTPTTCCAPATSRPSTSRGMQGHLRSGRHALPQLPITVDSEGFPVARSDFTEPVGPSYWERGER